MIVCVCRRISDQQIRRAANEGAVSLDCLRFELGVAEQCGSCADCATRVLCEARSRAAATTGSANDERRHADRAAG